MSHSQCTAMQSDKYVTEVSFYLLLYAEALTQPRQENATGVSNLIHLLLSQNIFNHVISGGLPIPELAHLFYLVLSRFCFTALLCYFTSPNKLKIVNL